MGGCTALVSMHDYVWGGGGGVMIIHAAVYT